MYRTDDPLADLSRHEDDQERWLRKRPLCSCCDEPITDEYCYMVNDEPVCEECLNDHFRKAVDDLCQ